MLKYTGHPLVDVGLATITAFANKDSPEELVEADLEAIAGYMAEQYTQNPLRGYLTVAFPNSGFTQPAFFTQPEKQEAYKKSVLTAFRASAPRLEETDFFLGLPVAQVALDVDGHLPPGRAFRQHIPLLTGEDVINFHPYGDAGIAISGEALLAIQALPLGSAKCGGRLFFVHSDNLEIMRYFAERFLAENRLAIHIAQQSGNDKMPEPSHKYRTLLIEMLLEALRRQLEQKSAGQPFSLTAYHLTNSGQGVDLNIYHFPNQVILYLREMLSATYSAAWKELVHRAWEITKAKRGETQAPEPARNYLYEDLFGVAEDVSRNAPRFIRTYFMRQAFRFAKDKIDPRGSYSLQSESALVSWKLTEPFLRRIVHMEQQRIENIRQMGDALAAYIQQQNDRRFFRNFYVIGRYDYLRNALIKANTEHVKRGNKPFLTLDSYISVFEEGEEVARADWRLARDLVLIRMVEQLYANGWLGANQDALPEATTEETPEQA
jgi:CRISPR-associated protein Cst1